MPEVLVEAATHDHVSAEHLYSATGLAPGSYQSSAINRHTPISRQGLPEHRDALMNLA